MAGWNLLAEKMTGTKLRGGVSYDLCYDSLRRNRSVHPSGPARVLSDALGRHVHLDPALARATQDVGVHDAGKCSVGLGRVANIGSGRSPLDGGVVHHAVPLELADLRPGRPIPGELNRLRNSRIAGRRAANDCRDALSARAARAEPIGLGVLPLRITGRHAGPVLWTNHERDRVLAVPGRSVGEGSWGKRQGNRERRGGQTDETAQTICGHRFSSVSSPSTYCYAAAIADKLPVRKVLKPGGGFQTSGGRGLIGVEDPPRNPKSPA